jgi:hypothetical protein
LQAEPEPTQLAARRRGQASRWWIHVALIVSATVSLMFEPVLTVHIIVGLTFVGLVGAHLVQRRRISAALLRRIPQVKTLHHPAGRLALADVLLTALTMGMFASGLWDWAAGHPTRIRWHALTGFVLAGYLVVHTVRRRARLRTSGVR